MTRRNFDSKPYRDAYVRENVRHWLARQIRVLREERGLSQEDFAKIFGKPQSTIARLEDPDYGRMSLTTLLKLASAFDVGLDVRFVPIATIAAKRDLSNAAMSVGAFAAAVPPGE